MIHNYVGAESTKAGSYSVGTCANGTSSRSVLAQVMSRGDEDGDGLDMVQCRIALTRGAALRLAADLLDASSFLSGRSWDKPTGVFRLGSEMTPWLVVVGHEHEISLTLRWTGEGELAADSAATVALSALEATTMADMLADRARTGIQADIAFQTRTD